MSPRRALPPRWLIVDGGVAAVTARGAVTNRTEGANGQVKANRIVRQAINSTDVVDDPNEEGNCSAAAPALTVSWKRPPARRRREIIVSNGSEDVRAIRAETRGTLVRSIAVGRRWLQEIVDGSSAGPDDIATRESCSRRHVMMMISLSFLAPDLIRTAMNGQLPRGIGVTRLIDAPIEWSRQWHMLGL